jgi:hypothetical protein
MKDFPDLPTWDLCGHGSSLPTTSPQTATMGILNAVGHFIPQVQNEQVDADAYGLSHGLNDIRCGLVVNIEFHAKKS